MMNICRISGRLHTRIYRLGSLVDEWTDDNLVVSGAATVTAHLVGGSVSGNSVTRVGFGSSTLPAAPGNTGLSLDALTKSVDGVSYPNPGQVAFAVSLGLGEANGLSLAEYGLLTAGGTLFARLVRAAPVVKDLSLSIQSVWTLTFGSPS
jgi:hypothetical protein